jgi:hypothetical protein
MGRNPLHWSWNAVVLIVPPSPYAVPSAEFVEDMPFSPQRNRRKPTDSRRAGIQGTFNHSGIVSASNGPARCGPVATRTALDFA